MITAIEKCGNNELGQVGDKFYIQTRKPSGRFSWRYFKTEGQARKNFKCDVGSLSGMVMVCSDYKKVKTNPEGRFKGKEISRCKKFLPSDLSKCIPEKAGKPEGQKTGKPELSGLAGEVMSCSEWHKIAGKWRCNSFLPTCPSASGKISTSEKKEKPRLTHKQEKALSYRKSVKPNEIEIGTLPPDHERFIELITKNKMTGNDIIKKYNLKDRVGLVVFLRQMDKYYWITAQGNYRPKVKLIKPREPSEEIFDRIVEMPADFLLKPGDGYYVILKHLRYSIIPGYKQYTISPLHFVGIDPYDGKWCIYDINTGITIVKADTEKEILPKYYDEMAKPGFQETLNFVKTEKPIPEDILIDARKVLKARNFISDKKEEPLKTKELNPKRILSSEFGQLPALAKGKLSVAKEHIIKLLCYRPMNREELIALGFKQYNEIPERLIPEMLSENLIAYNESRKEYIPLVSISDSRKPKKLYKFEIYFPPKSSKFEIIHKAEKNEQESEEYRKLKSKIEIYPKETGRLGTVFAYSFEDLAQRIKEHRKEKADYWGKSKEFYVPVRGEQHYDYLDFMNGGESPKESGIVNSENTLFFNKGWQEFDKKYAENYTKPDVRRYFIASLRSMLSFYQKPDTEERLSVLWNDSMNNIDHWPISLAEFESTLNISMIYASRFRYSDFYRRVQEVSAKGETPLRDTVKVACDPEKSNLDRCLSLIKRLKQFYDQEASGYQSVRESARNLETITSQALKLNKDNKTAAENMIIAEDAKKITTDALVNYANDRKFVESLIYQRYKAEINIENL